MTRIGGVIHLGCRGRGGQQFVEATERHSRLDPLIEHTRELLQWVEELVEIEKEGDQQPRRQRAVTDQVGAIPEDDRLGDRAEQLAAGEVDRHELHRAQASVAVPLRAGGEPNGVVVFAAE